MPARENGASGTGQTVPLAALPAVDEGDVAPIETIENDVSGTVGKDAGNPAFSRFWHVPESKPDDVPELSADDVPEDETDHVPEIGAGWRIEVTNKGLYWTWRKGSHANRVSLKGGKFWNLSPERKQAYEQNKREHHNRKQQAQGRRGK